MNPANQRNTQEEETWIKEASSGSLDAFNQLVLRYQDIAFHHAYALVKDADCAEDITQESFIKAYSSIRSLHGDSFRAWLLRIVTNTAYDLLRKFKRHPTQSLFAKDENSDDFESPAWLADPATAVETIIEHNEESKHLYKMLNELPDIYRSVITLVDLYELSYAEVSEILKVSLGTVKSRLSRAREKMLRKLQNDPEPRSTGGRYGYRPGDSQTDPGPGSFHHQGLT